MPSLLPAPKPDAGLLLLRVALGAIVLFHGVFKFTHGVDWIHGPLAKIGLPGFLAYGTYLAELVAPMLLILGAWTRLAALIVAIDMVMALVLVLGPQALTIKGGGGGWAIEIEAMIFFSALTLLIAGGGRYAVKPD